MGLPRPAPTGSVIAAPIGRRRWLDPGWLSRRSGHQQRLTRKHRRIRRTTPPMSPVVHEAEAPPADATSPVADLRGMSRTGAVSTRADSNQNVPLSTDSPNLRCQHLSARAGSCQRTRAHASGCGSNFGRSRTGYPTPIPPPPGVKQADRAKPGADQLVQPHSACSAAIPTGGQRQSADSAAVAEDSSVHQHVPP